MLEPFEEQTIRVTSNGATTRDTPEEQAALCATLPQDASSSQEPLEEALAVLR